MDYLPFPMFWTMTKHRTVCLNKIKTYINNPKNWKNGQCVLKKDNYNIFLSHCILFNLEDFRDDLKDYSIYSSEFYIIKKNNERYPNDGEFWHMFKR